MSASQYVLICDDGEVLQFGFLQEAKNRADELKFEGTTSHLYTHINTIDALPDFDPCERNGVEPGHDCPRFY